jgi:hypothetical protein
MRDYEASFRIIGNLNRFPYKVKIKPNLPRRTSEKIKGQTQAIRKNPFYCLLHVSFTEPSILSYGKEVYFQHLFQLSTYVLNMVKIENHNYMRRSRHNLEFKFLFQMFSGSLKASVG